MTARAPNFIDSETPSGVINGINKQFMISQGAVPSTSLRFFKNGALEPLIQDTTFSKGNLITSTLIPQVGDNLQAFYRNTSTLFYTDTNFADAEIPSGVIDGNNNTFIVAFEPFPFSSLEFYKNGQLLTPGVDYTVSRTVVSLNAPPLITDRVLVYYRYFGGCQPLYTFIDAEIVPGIDGINNTFALVNAAVGKSLKLYKNGLLQSPITDYIYNNGIFVTNTVPLVTDVLVAYYRYISSATPDRIQSNLKSSILPYLQRYLADPNAAIFSSSILQQLLNQAEVDINNDLNSIWIRYAISLQAGVPIYTLPENIKSVTRMTYKGYKVDMLTQKQMALLSPVYRIQNSRPRFATMQFEGLNALRLYPVPSENVPALSDENTIYTDANIQNEFVISAYIYPQECTEFFQLPDWFCRRTVKLFVLWKAYGMEGNGQDLELSEYYKKRYKAQMMKNREYMAKVYASKERMLDGGMMQINSRIHKPVLPPNFGTYVGY